MSADYLNKTIELSGSIPEPGIRSGNTGQQKHCFDTCQLIETWMYNIRLQAPNVRFNIGMVDVRSRDMGDLNG